MVPPFLAYYGVATHDMRFLEEAVQQCRLYDDVLKTNISLEDGRTCRGLWRHIMSDPAELEQGVCCSDPDVWLTSNAWAFAGITRVLATIQKWRPRLDSSVSLADYKDFSDTNRMALMKILASMLHCTMVQARDEQSGLLKNYLDGPAHRSAAYAYGDTAGTALMAASVYRLAVLSPHVFGSPLFLAWAEASRQAVAAHVNIDGRAGPVADVSHIPSRNAVEQTSEGQSMVVLMYSAWRDCVSAGICCKRGPSAWEGGWLKRIESILTNPLGSGGRGWRHVRRDAQKDRRADKQTSGCKSSR